MLIIYDDMMIDHCSLILSQFLPAKYFGLLFTKILKGISIYICMLHLSSLITCNETHRMQINYFYFLSQKMSAHKDV